MTRDETRKNKELSIEGARRPGRGEGEASLISYVELESRNYFASPPQEGRRRRRRRGEGGGDSESEAPGVERNSRTIEARASIMDPVNMHGQRTRALPSPTEPAAAPSGDKHSDHGTSSTATGDKGRESKTREPTNSELERLTNQPHNGRKKSPVHPHPSPLPRDPLLAPTPNPVNGRALMKKLYVHDAAIRGLEPSSQAAKDRSHLTYTAITGQAQG
ncbi:hypothetical protein BC827DRAFT_1154372 [Russula dissimulans]|nr:hypothetical protein BC827DRAFT_1154372 [Russula dissimulans]